MPTFQPGDRVLVTAHGPYSNVAPRTWVSTITMVTDRGNFMVTDEWGYALRASAGMLTLIEVSA